MLRQMLKAKIHRAVITESDLNYEGSLTIDENLLKEVDIIPFERVKVYNISNGERFDTYAIPGTAGSGVIGLNGAAARKGMVGDLIIIVTFGFYSEAEMEKFAPKIALLNEKNQIKKMLTR